VPPEVAADLARAAVTARLSLVLRAPPDQLTPSTRARR
jgi:Flp pilus assembly protein CpaB